MMSCFELVSHIFLPDLFSFCQISAGPAGGDKAPHPYSCIFFKRDGDVAVFLGFFLLELMYVFDDKPDDQDEGKQQNSACQQPA